MATYQWLSNDPMSEYDTSNSKVYTGVLNLEVPKWDPFQEAFETFGISLLRRGDLLTPSEIVRIQSGTPLTEVTYAPLMNQVGDISYKPLPQGMSLSDIENSPESSIRLAGVVQMYSIVYQRLQVRSQLTDCVNAMRASNVYGSSYYTGMGVEAPPIHVRFDDTKSFEHQSLDVQKDILEFAKQKVANQVEAFDMFFIPKFREFLDFAMAPESSSLRIPKVISRFATSRYIFGGGEDTEEQAMQLGINAASSQEASDINPNVFSRRGDGRLADPEMDMITSAFCRVLQNPNSVFPEDDQRVPGLRSPDLDAIQNQGLSSFYPRINLNPFPESYGISSQGANKRRSLLYMLRRLCNNRRVASAFGQRSALVEAYLQGGAPVKRMIMNCIFPFRPRANINVLRSSRIENYFFKVGGSQYICPARGFTASLFLMDFLNQGSRRDLRRHTVNYLSWVKSKCEASIRGFRAAQIASRVSLPSLYAARAATPKIKFFPEATQMTPPGLRALQTSRQPSGTPSRLIPLVPVNTPNVPVNLSSEEDSLEGRVSKQVEEKPTVKAAQVDAKHIYLVSTIAIVGSLGAFLYVRNRNK